MKKSWKKITSGIIILGILILTHPFSARASFSYYSPVTVQAAQVPSTQTNFPMLVSYTDTRLKTVGNGGHVQNANGYDIRPYSDTALTSALTYQLEYYNASTGQVVMWVKIASLANGSVVYLGYGDASISTDGSSSSTWDASSQAIYHLAESTGSNNLDSTSNGYTLTPANSPTQGTGQIDGSLAFNGTNQYTVQASAATIVNPASTDFTISTWLNATTFDEDGGARARRVIFFNIDGTNIFTLGTDNTVGGGNNLLLKVKTAGGGDQIYRYTTGGLSTNTWYHVAVTWNHNTFSPTFYLNGASAGLTTCGGCLGDGSADNKLYLAERSDGVAQFPGSLDETEIANTIRSADWITTEYNNQSAPTTFAVLGTEVPNSSNPTPVPIITMNNANVILINDKMIF